MGWSTNLFVNVSFNRKTYTSIAEVECDLEELNTSIKYNKEELRDLALMTEPEKLLKPNDDEGSETIYNIVRERVSTCLEILEEDIVARARLLLLRENWDACHDKETGLAIPAPNNINWDTAYLDGDFIPTTKNPNV